MTSYLKDHWNGHLPLWQAYWVNTILIPIFAGFVFTALMLAIPSVLMALLVMVAVSSLTVWGYVGTWCSATNYIDQHSYPRALLGWLAYLMVAIGWIKFAIALFALGS